MRRAHHRHRRAGQVARAAVGEAAGGLRRLGVRDLRRLLLPRAARARRRRRRHRDGGGDLPHQARRARSRVVHRREELPRLGDHGASARSENPKIEWLLNTAIEEILGEPGKAGVTRRAHQEPARPARSRRIACKGVFVGHRPPAQHRPVQGPARHGRERLPRPGRHQGRRRRRPRSRACSPPATSRITSTARPCRRRAPAAWPPSTPSDSCRTDAFR